MIELIDKLAGRWMDWRSDQAVQELPPELKELNLHRANVEDGSLQLVMTSPAIIYMVDEAAAMLNSQNAENYVQFDMMPRLDRGLRPIRITVAWANGEAPATRAARFKAQYEKALALLADLVGDFPAGVESNAHHAARAYLVTRDL